MSRFHWKWRRGALCNDSGVPLVRDLNLVPIERELMAAAPDLLDALRTITAAYNSETSTSAQAQSRADALALLKRLEGV